MLGRVIIVVIAIAMTLSACGDDDNTSTPAATTTVAPPVTATNTPLSPTTTPAGTFTYNTSAAGDERVVALLNSGYTDVGGEISGAVTLHNRNQSEAVVVVYTVTPAYGGTDGTPATSTIVLLPNQELQDAFSGTYPTGETLKTVKISVLPSVLWVPFSSPDRLTTELSSSGRAEGTVTNPFDNDTGPLRLSLIARDEGGGIIASKSTALDSIPALGTADFTVPIPDSITAFVVYVSFADEFPAWMTAP